MGKYVSDAPVVSGGALVDKYVETLAGPYNYNFVDDVEAIKDSVQTGVFSSFVLVCKSLANGTVIFTKVNKTTGEVMGSYQKVVGIYTGDTYPNQEMKTYSWYCDGSYIYLAYKNGWNISIEKISVATMSVVSELPIVTDGDNYNVPTIGCIIGDTTGTYLFLSCRRNTDPRLYKVNLSAFTINGYVSTTDHGGNYIYSNLIILKNPGIIAGLVPNTLYFWNISTLTYSSFANNVPAYIRRSIASLTGNAIYYIDGATINLCKMTYPERILATICAVTEGVSTFSITSDGSKLALGSGVIVDVATGSSKYYDGIFGDAMIDVSSDKFDAYAFAGSLLYKPYGSIPYWKTFQTGIGCLHKFEIKKVYA